jgi:WD40 repeat protein
LLVSVGLGTKGIRYRERRTGVERDLSWFDWGLVADISADGSTLLFSEGGTAGTIGRSVYVRRIDGSPAIRLGTGLAEALSPDGLTALALEGDDRLIALPVGPGSRRTLTGDRFVCSAARWFPDGKRILVAASESGRPVRAWVLDLDRGSMDPVTPEGITGIFVSPDGAWFLAGSPNRLYPVPSGEPRPIPGLTTADQPLGWDRNSRHAYYRRD